MAEYRINASGELVVEDEDGDTTVTPEADFPQILALITPRVSPGRVTFTLGGGVDGDELQWHCGSQSGLLFYARGAERENGDVLPDECDDYSELAAYIFKHQPAVSVETVKAWGTRDVGARNAYVYLTAQQPAQASAPPNRLHIDDAGDLMYGASCIAMRHANAYGIFGRIVFADLALSAAEVADLVGMPSIRAVEWLRRRLDQSASSVKPAPWYRSADGLLFHRSYDKMHVIGSVQACPDDQDAAEWALAAQPEVNAEDLAYLTTAHNTSHNCAIRLREIRAAMEGDERLRSAVRRLRLCQHS